MTALPTLDPALLRAARMASHGPAFDRPRLQRVMDGLMTYCEVTYADLTSTRRMRNITRCRQAIAAILHDELGMSYPEIGSLLGRNQHSSAFTQAAKFRGLDEATRWPYERAAEVTR